MNINDSPALRREYQNRRNADKKEERLNAVVEMYLMFRNYNLIREVLTI